MKFLSAILLTPVVSLLMSLTAQTAIRTEVIEYKQGDTVLEGYLAYDDGIQGRRPGVLVVHEWTGIGPYIRSRTEQLAQLGYVAFAADIYGRGVRPQNPEAAGAEAKKYRHNRPLMRQRAQAGLQVLQQQSLVDRERIAAIGYCFGGTTVLELARSGAAIAGVVSFHGGLNTPNPADAQKIKARVLVLHGAADPLVPQTEVVAFQEEMATAKVDWQMISYGGAVHSFTNPQSGNDPSTGVAYNARADLRSWQALQQFFAEIFR